MPTVTTSTALKRLIQLRIDALTDVWDEGDQVFARDVEWHAPDERGCNWDMKGYRGPADYATEVRLIVSRLQREYRLADEPALWGDAHDEGGRYDGTALCTVPHGSAPAGRL